MALIEFAMAYVVVLCGMQTRNKAHLVRPSDGIMTPAKQKNRRIILQTLTTVTLSQLESHFWESANILRGPVDAASRAVWAEFVLAYDLARRLSANSFTVQLKGIGLACPRFSYTSDQWEE